MRLKAREFNERMLSFVKKRDAQSFPVGNAVLCRFAVFNICTISPLVNSLVPLLALPTDPTRRAGIGRGDLVKGPY